MSVSVDQTNKVIILHDHAHDHASSRRGRHFKGHREKERRSRIQRRVEPSGCARRQRRYSDNSTHVRRALRVRVCSSHDDRSRRHRGDLERIDRGQRISDKIRNGPLIAVRAQLSPQGPKRKLFHVANGAGGDHAVSFALLRSGNSVNARMKQLWRDVVRFRRFFMSASPQIRRGHLIFLMVSQYR